MNDLYYSLNPCIICESSTQNKPFTVNGKRYVLCDDCFNVLHYVCKQILKDNK